MFIQSATSVLHRFSNTSSTIEIPPWSLTSFEVTIYRTEGAQFGVGSFGSIYRGDWNGQASLYFRALDQIETVAGILQVVAVKEMHVQDARLLDDETLAVCMHG